MMLAWFRESLKMMSPRLHQGGEHPHVGRVAASEKDAGGILLETGESFLQLLMKVHVP